MKDSLPAAALGHFVMKVQNIEASHQSEWSDQPPNRRLARITLRVGETSGAEPHTKGVGRLCLKYALSDWMSTPIPSR
jgi:hypothetical protein